ncbi:5-dehydro-4-deoxy-D-glucuronate isomerase [uncultured Imperialibacter sp.]|uniref:5-dehydro-4-deoxy-D-glucuronate isomerase n=1 Tax=uncultured Imperialibacter sp. TaxID=1672639 RepID=UPI0030DDBA1C|tara:strand:+ start:17859 stop:18695 length:837 start_codon:yes stop_codon:yes gene_type:complete
MPDIRFASHPEDIKQLTTSALRERFLISEVMKPGQVTASYSMHDRMMVIGVVPTIKAITLPTFEELTKANFFLERRELGIINVGAKGTVTVDGERFELDNKECLYVGRGKKEIVFSSGSPSTPAELYVNSCPAHREYPTTKATFADANEVNVGSKENCNERTIYQYIHDGGIQSCQLVMGLTILAPGSIWNTFPPHTHNRRMEVYFYFDLPEDQIVMHFMGEPQETRHLAMSNKQAVISPEWSIHAGAGTSNYTFIWSMAGENKAFKDMDGHQLKSIR